MIYSDKIPFERIAKTQCIIGAPRTLSEAEKLAPGAHILINTAIFEFGSGEILSRVVADGATKGKSATWGIGFPTSGNPVWTWDNAAGAEHYVGAYTYAVRDGQNKDGLKDNAKRGRTALGLTAEGELVVYLVTDGDTQACSTATLCQRLLDMGCVNAINLDGGGSSQGVTPAGRYDSGRKVPAWLALWMKEEDKPMKVCIDAGHGIETAGKRSPDGSYLEYEFNRDVAGRIKKHLERCGVSVVLTCPDEHDVPLSERCKICNDAGCDYFISIHTNASGEGWSDVTGWSAHIIAKGGKAEQLAEKIRTAAIPLLGCRDRGMSVDNYQVLRDTKCPAVLVEHGFHTSRTEVEKLKTPQYRAKCAEADVRGLCEHMGVTWADEPKTPKDTVSVRRRVIDGETWVAAADIQ
ncbi:MAG: hypothetical protein ABT01_02950 [Clostridium sp. SCN 57-10]|nr:MAG: hypothetical protein ABT01_02950 [Clostridium sp. SCN 57-10]